MMRTGSELNRLDKVRVMHFECQRMGQGQHGGLWLWGESDLATASRMKLDGVRTDADTGIRRTRAIFVRQGARAGHNAGTAKPVERRAGGHDHEVLGGSGSRMSIPDRHCGQDREGGDVRMRQRDWHWVNEGSSWPCGPVSSVRQRARVCLRCRLAIRPK